MYILQVNRYMNIITPQTLISNIVILSTWKMLLAGRDTTYGMYYHIDFAACVFPFWRYLSDGRSRKTRQTGETSASCCPSTFFR